MSPFSILESIPTDRFVAAARSLTFIPCLLEQGGVLFIENVGNLACPAGFDLGEAHKVVILSVTEGDDKPVKYPEAFAAADLLVISKSDLAPYCDFDIEACIARAREINPAIESIVVSARNGTGMTEWLDWIVACLGAQRSRWAVEALPQRALRWLLAWLADLPNKVIGGKRRSRTPPGLSVGGRSGPSLPQISLKIRR